MPVVALARFGSCPPLVCRRVERVTEAPWDAELAVLMREHGVAVFELRERADRIPGVDLPLSRLELRPSFPLRRLVGEAGLAAAIEAQAWFLGQQPVADDPMV